MSEEPKPVLYPVEICDMTWFPQVGLFLDDVSDAGSWIMKPAVQGILEIGKWNGFDKEAFPYIGTGSGPMYFRQDVREWLEEKGWTYDFSRTPCITSPHCRGVVRFSEASQALLFKLTWYND